jgi:hypothetical protein
MARWPAPNPKASNQESQALKQRYSSDHFVEEATEGLSKNGHSTHPNPKDPTHTSKQNQNSKQGAILRAKNRIEINPDQNQIADAQTKQINAGGSAASIPLSVFQVEPFCAAAEPSESSSSTSTEPRAEQAWPLLPIADPRRQQLQEQY